MLESRAYEPSHKLGELALVNATVAGKFFMMQGD